MADPIIEAAESVPHGSSAMAVVACIYSMHDVTLEGKRSMAAIFMASYRELAKDYGTADIHQKLRG